ncbi:MAG: type 1 fimbrial protein [Stenotrophomonas sp.]|nr:type 1 fimbrial protein [Stenotrophomonas sp.]
MLAYVSPCLADTAALTISGRVQPGTCTVSAAPITLDPIRADQLVHGDNSLKESALQLAGCVGVSTAELSFEGTADPANAEVWKNTAATGAANGLAIALLSGSSGSTYVKKGDTLSVSISGNAGSLAVRAGYHLSATGPAAVSAGDVQTEIVITAVYN